MSGVIIMKIGASGIRLPETAIHWNGKRGYTVIELMVTIIIVTVLAATVGMFFVKLLTIQENEREEAYIREKLTDICGAYADDLSVGRSFSRSNHTEIVTYRQESGGVSLETGRVTRVAFLSLSLTNREVRLDISGFVQREIVRKNSRGVRGDASLIPLVGDMVSFRITPLKGNSTVDGDSWTSDAALGWLEATARYRIEGDDGNIIEKPVTVGRVVRLWNSR